MGDNNNTVATEALGFKIGLSGTYWDKKPDYTILVDNVECVKGTIKGNSDELELVEFTCDLVDNQEHTLQIRLENKTMSDVVESEDKTSILKDMLLNIESIEIDGIDMGQMKWSQSEFVGDHPDRPRLDSCVNLGWNGTYSFKFSSPFYLWLLENM